MLARGHQTGKMRHIHVEIGPDHIRNFPHPREIYLARHRGSTGDQQLWFMFFGQRFHLIIINAVIILAHAILHCVEPFSRLIRARAMGQMPTRVERHSKDGISGFQKGLKNPLIGLAARIGLNIGKIASE